jgi:hypothetical protein
MFSFSCGLLAQNRKFKEKGNMKQDQLHENKETDGATSTSGQKQ